MNVLAFQQKIILAMMQVEQGEPLKDFLADEEIEQGLQVLADIFIAAGIPIPE